MNIRKRILIPMITLTIVSGVAVLIASILLFNRELNNAVYEKTNVAAMVVDYELTRMQETARVAAIGLASDPDLVEAVMNYDRETVMAIANRLKLATQLDYVMIYDSERRNLVRTHQPELYGDYQGHMPHVHSAFNGHTEAYIVRGTTILLGASAGTPVFDAENNVVSVITLGFMLNDQDVVKRLKALTNCDVAIFRNDERIATTLLNDDGTYMLGIMAAENISEMVLAGGSYIGRTQIYGRRAVSKYIPIHGANDEVLGMIGITYFTAEETGRLIFFILTGILITLAVLVVCVVIARIISDAIQNRLDKALNELKETEEANKLQIVLLNSVIKATKITVWDMENVTGDPVSPYNRILWSDDFRQALGYSGENDFPNILNSLSVVMHPDDKANAFGSFAGHVLDKTGQTPFDVEYRLMKKNGGYAYFRATGETIRDTDGTPLRVAGALMDITETKNILTEMKEKQAEAEAANQTKTVFLANMSHEIRTPMNSIIGFSELAQYGDIPDKTREYLVNIQDSAEWLLKIINDILDISKIESGKIILERIPFDLPDIFEHCQSAITPKTKEKGIMLYCYAEPSVGKRLLGDPVRVRQVLTNLLSNAVKFTNVGMVKLLASIDSRSDTTVTICFEIKDSGIGMTKEQIAKIFDPFTQADASVTRRFGGTGLGLTITKNIIEMMGGQLSVESAIGVGSRFSFTLTFDMVEEASGNGYTKKIIVNEHEKPNFVGEVLICEDNSLNQQVICDHLARVGLTTVMAHNGKVGVDILAERLKNGEKPFDLIFMDIHMPVMDGLDAAIKIIEMGVKTPIVALTANVMSNDLELYKISGMSDTVGKPFTTQELWRCLVKYLPVESYTAVDKNRQSVEEDKMLKQLKTNFVKANRNTFMEFATAIKSNDTKTAHRLAHTLKSNAGQIGEKRLQTAAAVAENALTEGIGSIQDEHIRPVEIELKRVLDRLAPLLETTETKQNPAVDADREKMLETLNKLKPLIKSRDTKCLTFVDELRNYPKGTELIDQLEGYKFKQALETLDKIEKEFMADNE